MCACFRPLSGSYISQSPEQFCQYISDRFRPLSGSYISQCSESFNPEVITFCFRPLSGSYISQSSTHHSAILHYRFPSPIGELHFSIVRNAYWTKKTISVSVPYRGATFLNDVRLRGYDKRTEVSVPYRGATFLNNKIRSAVRPAEKCFRPLSGSYISQSFQGYPVPPLTLVSVPYRGATFLNTIPATPCPVWDE